MIGSFGPGVDVVYGPPAPLGEVMCQRCDREGVVAVADVTWPVPCNPADELREGVIVCRECIAPVVEQARGTVTLGGTISVDVPRWRSEVLIEQIGITYRQLDHWRRAGYVECEEGRAVGSGVLAHFLADEVDRITRFSLLVSAGVRHDAADRLLRARPDVARQVAAVLTSPRPVAVPA